MSMIKVIANNKTLGTMELLPEDFVVRLVPVDSSVSSFSDVHGARERHHCCRSGECGSWRDVRNFNWDTVGCTQCNKEVYFLGAWCSQNPICEELTAHSFLNSV